MLWFDILLFAALAVFFFLKLNKQLGQRHGEERERPNPLERAEKEQQRKESAVILPLSSQRVDNHAALNTEDEGLPVSLAAGIERISHADADFNEKDFLEGARGAFRMIVEAFAAGDMETLGSLLSPSLLAQFEKTIRLRTEAGQQLETRILHIRDVALTAARLEGGRYAMVTVEITSEQINILRGANGQIIEPTEGQGGTADAAGQAEIVIDVWSFRRDTKADDPNWHLVATGIPA